MPQINKTTTITLGEDANATFDVSKMSNQVQQMVMYMDEWRQKEQDLVSDILMVRAALKEIQTSLRDAIETEQKETLSKAQALGLISDEDTQQAGE